MARRTYTDHEKHQALELYEQLGPAEAERRTGIPKGTIASWANRTGVATVATEQRAAAVEAAKLTMAERKARLAEGLMDDIERLRQQLWAPTVEKVVKTVGRGEGHSEAVIVDVELDQPTFGDQKSIMTSLAIAVDKVQILTGDVTSRTETVGQVERPQAEERLAQVLELAQRRTA